MIKVLAPHAYCKPEMMASSHLWNHLDEAFAENGFHHVIYVPIPTRGVTKEEREEYKKRRREVIYDGKLIINRFSLYGEGQNSVLRALRYFLSCFISLWKCLHGKDAKDCNVIYSVSTPPIIGAMSAIVKKRKGIPFVYVLQDIFPDSLVGTGLAKKDGFLWKIGRKIEDFTYNHADKIIVIGDDFKRNIMAKGVPGQSGDGKKLSKVAICQALAKAWGQAIFMLPKELETRKQYRAKFGDVDAKVCKLLTDYALKE